MEINYLLALGLLIVVAAVIAAFRQYRERYGWVFVCFGISEIAALIFWKVFGFRGNHWYILMLIPIIYGFLFRKFNKKHLLYLIPLGIITLFIIPERPEDQLLLFALGHFVIFLFLAYDALLDMLVTEELNLFYVVFVLFEVNAITKLLFILFKINISITYYYPSAIFAVLVYSYFIFFSYSRPGFRIQIKHVRTKK